MPTITRWMLKTSLVYFLLALIVGLLQSTVPLVPENTVMEVFRSVEPVRIHLLVVGWITQLIFGIAIWMFPKYTREKPRGSAGLGWASYVLLNFGLVLRTIGEGAAQPGTIFGWMLVVSSACLWLAGLAFLLIIWPRIKEK
jgi:hypothetical protein